MTIKMRLTSLLAASVLAASAGLVTGFAAAPAGAVPPVGPTDEQQCTVSCGPDEPDGPVGPGGGPGGFEVCTEDCSSHPRDPDPEDPDVPIPTDANFTG